MPDGGLLLIAEDRTETLRISAMRDTLLRTRTATFDSLFEAVGVFAPDGRMQIWNRRFASSWGLDSTFLDDHPHIRPCSTGSARVWPARVRRNPWAIACAPPRWSGARRARGWDWPMGACWNMRACLCPTAMVC
jgi:hypothetical protein